MKKTFIISLIALFVGFKASAQCSGCGIAQDEFFDYCYTSADYPDLCAVFSDKHSKFRLSLGKKVRELPKSKDYNSGYFLALAKDKALKINALEMLFVQEAASKWMVERHKYGHTYTSSGLGIKVLSEGDGPLPEAGKTVVVHYTGYLEDGTKFDSSVDRGQPFKFVLGQGQVIKGWDEGVAKLKVGSKAVLLIPPGIAYGEVRRGPIPPNSTLYFEIEVLSDQQ